VGAELATLASQAEQVIDGQSAHDPADPDWRLVTDGFPEGWDDPWMRTDPEAAEERFPIPTGLP
jgi:hypothetical protein